MTTTHAPSDPSIKDDPRRAATSQPGFAQRLYGLLGRFSLLVIMLMLIVVFSIAKPEQFFTTGNFEAIFINQVVVVFAALGLIAPLIVGELDLSVGYLVGFAQALVVGLMTLQGLPILAALALTLMACAVVGMINGLLVVKVGINSLIATLATGTILYGLVLWYTDGTGAPREPCAALRADA